MAQDVECLYAGVKALVCVVRSNKAAQAEMDRRKGYQTLAMLLKRKKQLLNSHILHLIFGLVGTVDSQKETSSIPNLTAFQVSFKSHSTSFIWLHIHTHHQISSYAFPQHKTVQDTIIFTNQA